jgi:Rrf2 family protein
VLADVASAIADGAEVICDFRAMVWGDRRGGDVHRGTASRRVDGGANAGQQLLQRGWREPAVAARDWRARTCRSGSGHGCAGPVVVFLGLNSECYPPGMRLADGVESSLHLCVLLAAVSPGAVPAAQLAEFHALASAATAKTLQQLAGAGVIEARPGRTGGYALARPAEHITVAEIVAAASGPGPAFRCREIRRHGPCAGPPLAYSARCVIAQLMSDAEDAWWEALRARSLAALAERVSGQVDDTIRARTQSWLREKARTV